MTAPQPSPSPTTPSASPATKDSSRARRIAGWVLAAVAALVGAITAWFAGEFTGGYGPTSGDWAEGAWWALSFGAFGVVLTIVLALLAILLGKGVWVRVVAVAVIAGVVVGTMVLGGQGVVDRYAAAAKAPDCSSLGSNSEIQAAFDELRHPGWVDTLAGGPAGCGVAVRNYSADEAIEFYGDQLIDAGWVIEEVGAVPLVAHREGYTFTLSACGGESWMEITEEGTRAQGC